MKMSNKENEWEDVYKSFQSIRLEPEEKQTVLDTLQVNMSKKKKTLWSNFHAAPILSVLLLVMAFLVGGYFLVTVNTNQNSYTSGGAYPTPQIPVLEELNLRLSQDQMDKWYILDGNGKVVGKLGYCENQCDAEIDRMKVMEERELKGFTYATTLIREHVKSLDVFQIQHFIMSREDGEPFAYMQIIVPDVDHELEQEASVILESFQNNLR
ncbi:hypothetical protein AB685_11930 [Bacillus sp. LL01]|uniref:hypothetical protein n=1 Tax=Bacillus sp. LL01 TaxID=1665556 RepID=UPI00064D2862|nr:hypothetical protein [Bacillus sp. LL01]KMJ58579.1 hypothetical protein AB685_11930 [Bacillus sp. LL01]